MNLDQQGTKAVGETAIEAGGTVVHLQGYRLIRIFRIVSRDGDTEHWATDDLAMDELTRLTFVKRTWAIESDHRGLKPCCGVERCQTRSGRAQRNHIGMSIRAFLWLERHSYAIGVSWYEAKAKIIRGAIGAYSAKPLYVFYDCVTPNFNSFRVSRGPRPVASRTPSSRLAEDPVNQRDRSGFSHKSPASRSPANEFAANPIKSTASSDFPC